MTTVSDVMEIVGTNYRPAGSNCFSLYPNIAVRRVGCPDVLHATMIGLEHSGKFQGKMLEIGDDLIRR